MSELNHSHPLVMQVTDLQAVLTSTNQLAHSVESQYNLVPSDLVAAVFAAHAKQQDAGERRKVQLNLHRYAQCAFSNQLQGV